MSVVKDEKPAMPVVRISDDGVTTNSRDVAEVFGKNHRDVVRSVDDLLRMGGPLRNFAQGSYTLPSTGSQKHRCYDMDRDGFMLLAMGFTGAKALQWKLRYIEAFNDMESELRRLQAIDCAYGDRRDYPSTDGQLLWGQPISKVNAAANMLSAVMRTFGPEAARELYRREVTMPPLDGYEPGPVLERGDMDSAGCLKHLLRLATEKGASLGETLDLARYDAAANGRLRRHGVDAQPSQRSEFFAVAIKHGFLAEGFADTPWIGDWAKALTKLQGSRVDRLPRRFGKETSASVLIPYSALLTATG